MLNKKLLMALLVTLVIGWMAAPRVSLAGGVLTVTGLVIDKTDKNAVVARDAALAEARRAAFQAVAQRSMTAAELKSFAMPDDKAIELLVQDFEIRDEKVSADRYMATFTVRFMPDISMYISVPAGVGPVIDLGGAAAGGASSSTPSATATAENPAAPTTPAPAAETPAPAAVHYDVPTGPRNVLILPYLKDTSGKKLLWEDPNPWRETWQDKGNATRPPSLTVTVPQGDLDDVAAGNTDAPWSGDYAGIEKLRATYQATEVALAVANQAVTPAVVDLFMYHDGKFVRLKSLQGFRIGEMEAMVSRVIDAVTAPQVDETAAIEKPAEKAAEKTDAPAAPVSSEPLKLSLVMNFSSFSQWADAQRRLAAVVPPLTVNISSLSQGVARFSIVFTGGGIETLKATLIGKGLALNEPVVEVGEAVMGNTAPTQNTVYELTLLSGGNAPTVP